jgi:hypothetical protein
VNDNPTHCWIAVLDIAGFSSRPNPVQRATVEAFQALVRSAVADARLDWERIDDEWTGDGYLLLIPADVSPVLVGGSLVRALRDGLRATGEWFNPAYRIRARLALHQGATHGFVGDAVNLACHLVDTPLLKETLRNAPAAELAVIATDSFHREVIRPGHRLIDPADWASASVDLKTETGLRAWLMVPGYPSPPLPAQAAAPAPAASPAPQPVSQHVTNTFGGDQINGDKIIHGDTTYNQIFGGRGE